MSARANTVRSFSHSLSISLNFIPSCSAFFSLHTMCTYTFRSIPLFAYKFGLHSLLIPFHLKSFFSFCRLKLFCISCCWSVCRFLLSLLFHTQVARKWIDSHKKRSTCTRGKERANTRERKKKNLCILFTSWRALAHICRSAPSHIHAVCTRLNSSDVELTSYSQKKSEWVREREKADPSVCCILHSTCWGSNLLLAKNS